MRGDERDVLGFLSEVELFANHGADLGVIRLETAQAREELHDAEDAADRGEVELRDLVDVRVLHLHGDATPIVQPGFVYLREGRARHRLRIPPREELRRSATKLALDPIDDLLDRTRRNRVLQSLQLAAELLRQKIRENADQLSDLDEQTIELENRALHATCVCAMPLDQAALIAVRCQKRTAQSQREIAGEHTQRNDVRLRETKTRSIVVQ